MVVSTGQGECGKPGQIELVLIGKAVRFCGTGPFFGEFHAFRAIKTKTVIVVWISGSEIRALDDLRRTMIDCELI
jgi:hypothetical protein